MGAIDDLEAAALRLEEARIELDNALVALDFRHVERQALGALGADTVSCARYLLPHAVAEAHVAVQVATAAVAAMNVFSVSIPPSFQPGPDGVPEVPQLPVSIDFDEIARRLRATDEAHAAGNGARTRLLLAFKNAYFIIRALQDALYRVAFEVIEHRRPKNHQYASMKSALDDTNDPVHALLGEHSTDYLAWFAGWRNLRNSIKLGRPDSFAGSALGRAIDDYGLSLVTVDQSGGITVDVSRATRVSDVVTALEMTTLLMKQVSDAAKSDGSPRSDGS